MTDNKSSQPSTGREAGRLEGTIVRKTGGGYHVKIDGGSVRVCTLRSRLRKDLDVERKSTDRSAGFGKQIARANSAHGISVGDRVRLTPAPDNEGVIDELLPRRSAFMRRSPGKYQRNQVLVSNLDAALIVFSLTQPKLNPAALDRFLVAAHSQDLDIVICFNKVDLIKDQRDATGPAERYREIGYRAILASATQGDGIPQVAEVLAGRMTALIGPSGVGKSSLLAALDPSIHVRIGEVRGKHQKGSHTTTDVTMLSIQLPDNASGVREALVVDMPGLRELGLAHLDPGELDGYFPEIAPLKGECRFAGKCLHRAEPDCAVRAAVEAGTVLAERYESYLKMLVYLEEQQQKW